MRTRDPSPRERWRPDRWTYLLAAIGVASVLMYARDERTAGALLVLLQLATLAVERWTAPPRED